MLCGEATFTQEEIIDFLKKEGLQQGDPKFAETLRKRYVPVEGGEPPLYMENPSWTGNGPMTRLDVWEDDQVSHLSHEVEDEEETPTRSFGWDVT